MCRLVVRATMSKHETRALTGRYPDDDVVPLTAPGVKSVYLTSSGLGQVMHGMRRDTNPPDDKHGFNTLLPGDRYVTDLPLIFFLQFVLQHR